AVPWSDNCRSFSVRAPGAIEHLPAFEHTAEQSLATPSYTGSSGLSGGDDLGHGEGARKHGVGNAGQMAVKLVQNGHQLVDLLREHGLGKLTNVFVLQRGDSGVELVHDISRTHVRQTSTTEHSSSRGSTNLCSSRFGVSYRGGTMGTVLFADIASTSAAVAATSGRRAKVELLAAALQALAATDDPLQIEAGAAYLAGEMRQRQIGVGWAS